MAWVVDTCVLLDVLEGDPDFGMTSATVLEERAADGLAICPVTYVELAPAFGGDRALQDEFLAGVGADLHTPWLSFDTDAAHEGWARHVAAKRAGATPKRPIADILIGAYAVGRTGLITRNPGDFAIYPELDLVVP